MKSWHKILLNCVSAIITFCLLYQIVSIFIYNDYLASLIPGWHTTIYPKSGVLRITILIGFSAVFAYLIFKLILRLLTYFWLKVLQ